MQRSVIQERAAPLSYKIALACVVLCAGLTWFLARDVRAGWYGVPPVLNAHQIILQNLGDAQLGYRRAALDMQILGDEGGRVLPIAEYDYSALSQWFLSLYKLDKRSDFIPMLAAYYYSATPKAEDLRFLVEYLEVAGDSIVGEKWRWLVQATYLARFKVEDLDYAMVLAQKLANLADQNADMPIWTKQMPAFVLTQRGDKDAARDMMRAILASAEDLHPNEINFMEAYIVERLQ